ncbi:50S ribosomal protein L21 [Patescibacteria group bacterium]|nr:50S ribosomal protein L21 [Candidatus Falkowbacteria bacterium]MBU3905872.1 50S ribosomal protein L21 [Patescibacteria group bacterium]MCG2697802.1 50S ribosomal protein L21 [Candidatus Parcubacteria bacterium]MBU4015757.1 50S ribosomal protein L21 [Patescibacteria group bacterium]MBU4026986.1 50S ribosomal protein L21 [Patescibacteria group bacterium]
MATIAVIKTGGKQYKVKKGQNIKIEKLSAKNGAKVKFDTLLTASSDGKEVNIGKPSLGEKVEGKVVEQGRDKKVMVVKYKNKTRYKRTLGHRQPFTKVEITGIAN